MKFEKLLEAVPDALVGMDQKGVIRFVNAQTESLFGFDRDELIGQRIETLVPEPLWQIYAQNREQYFADPRTRSSGLEVELSGRHHNGGEFPINISMSLIDTGDVLLVITGAGDVARQQQAVRTRPPPEPLRQLRWNVGYSALLGRDRDRPRNSAITAPSDSRVSVTSVRPLRPYAVRWVASATKTSPRRATATKLMSAPAATANRPQELQASEKAESARVNRYPPCAIP